MVMVLTHLTHLFLKSTTKNSKKNEINDSLYHAPGDKLFYKKKYLPHGNGTHLCHLFLNSTKTNSKKSEINDYLYHAPGNLLF